MVSIVLVSHNDIGKAMLAATKKIIPECKNISEVSIESDSPPEASKAKILEAVKAIDNGTGIILLADMFGGTPSNMCLPFLSKGKVEVISGFNLPMLIKLASFAEQKNLQETTKFIKTYGQKNIVIASEVLEGKIEYR